MTATRRRTVMKRLLAALLLLPLLAACSSDRSSDSTPGSPDARHGADGSLSEAEEATALEVAREVVADQGASVSSASAIARSRTVASSNTGHPCTSGRVLEIKLIGDFPHTVTTGHAVRDGEPAPDFTVRAMLVTADARSGRACLIGVQTAENGEPQPLPDATILQVP